MTRRSHSQEARKERRILSIEDRKVKTISEVLGGEGKWGHKTGFLGRLRKAKSGGVSTRKTPATRKVESGNIVGKEGKKNHDPSHYLTVQ